MSKSDATEEEFSVEKVLNRRVRNGKVSFFTLFFLFLLFFSFFHTICVFFLLDLSLSKGCIFLLLFRFSFCASSDEKHENCDKSTVCTCVSSHFVGAVNHYEVRICDDRTNSMRTASLQTVPLFIQKHVAEFDSNTKFHVIHINKPVAPSQSQRTMYSSAHTFDRWNRFAIKNFSFTTNCLHKTENVYTKCGFERDIIVSLFAFGAKHRSNPIINWPDIFFECKFFISTLSSVLIQWLLFVYVWRAHSFFFVTTDCCQQRAFSLSVAISITV